MNKESRQPSIEQLETRKERLDKIIGQREKLIGNLGKKVGVPGLSNLDQDLTIANDIIPRVQASQERAINSLESVTKEIDSISQTGELIENARSYLSEIELRQAQLDKLREAADAGRLRQEVWLLRRQELAELRARANQDPDLKRGIDLLKQKEKEKEKKPGKRKNKRKSTALETKEKQLSKMVLDTQSQEVTIDGNTIKVKSEIRWKVLVYLAQKSNRNIPYKKIAKIAKYAGYKGENPAGNAINLVRRSIERDFRNPQILTHSGSRGTSKYRLNAQVEFVGEKVEVSKKADSKKGLPQLIESRKEALDAFLWGFARVEDVIKLLGPSRYGRPLTRPQAMFALGRCVNLLYAKIKNDQATEEDKKLWERIKNQTNETDDRRAWKDSFDAIKAWFTKDKPLTEAEVTQVENIEKGKIKPLTDEEAAILAFAIDANRELLRKAGLAQIDPQITKDLYAKIKDRVKIDKEKLTETRRGIFEKVERMIESDALYELIDLESPEALKLLDYLTSTDSKKLLEFLKTWLSGGNLDELIDEFNHERNGNGFQEPQKKTIKTKKWEVEQRRPEAEEKYHTIEELAKELNIPHKILQDRIFRLTKKDASIKPERRGKKLFFNDSDFEKIKSQVSKPVREKKEGKKESTLEEEKQALGLNITREIVSHFANNDLGQLNKDLLKFIRQFVIPDSKLDDRILEKFVEGTILKFTADLVIPNIEKLWSLSSSENEIEKQIISAIKKIKQREVQIKTVIRSFSRYFGLPIPEQYQKGEPKPKKGELKKSEKQKATVEKEPAEEKKEPITKIEKRDPQTREKINKLVKEIKATGQSSFSSKQLNHHFSKLSSTIQKLIALEKRWVRPATRKDGRHPKFNEREAVFMLYYVNFGNGLNNSIVKELFKIIDEETEKIEKENSKKNGSNDNRKK